MNNSNTPSAFASELSLDEIQAVSGGQYAAIAPWAVGTSSALQAIMVQKLEILGNPIVH